MGSTPLHGILCHVREERSHQKEKRLCQTFRVSTESSLPLSLSDTSQYGLKLYLRPEKEAEMSFLGSVLLR